MPDIINDNFLGGSDPPIKAQEGVGLAMHLGSGGQDSQKGLGYSLHRPVFVRMTQGCRQLASFYFMAGRGGAGDLGASNRQTEEKAEPYPDR